ncbi:hypothetical protein [Corynebacterium mayonis]|uniref:hypothetical protein n=1 Tax=Corynebacterium mayonis TaxID=3062461 RepID=UPI0031405D29
MIQVIIMLLMLTLTAVTVARRKLTPGKELFNTAVTAGVLILVSQTTPWNTALPYLLWLAIAAAAAVLVGISAARLASA